MSTNRDEKWWSLYGHILAVVLERHDVAGETERLRALVQSACLTTDVAVEMALREDETTLSAGWLDVATALDHEDYNKAELICRRLVEQKVPYPEGFTCDLWKLQNLGRLAAEERASVRHSSNRWWAVASFAVCDKLEQAAALWKELWDEGVEVPADLELGDVWKRLADQFPEGDRARYSQGVLPAGPQVRIGR